MTENDNHSSTEAPNPTRQYPKAMRIQRVAAVLIDGLLVVTLLSLTPFVSNLGLEGYFETASPIPGSVVVQLIICTFVIFLLVNGWWIYRYGQTVGKRVLRIAIATNQYKVPPFNRVVLVRYFPFMIAFIFPILNPINIVDWLMILRDDRRCLHDILAGTQVIDVSQTH